MNLNISSRLIVGFAAMGIMDSPFLLSVLREVLSLQCLV